MWLTNRVFKLEAVVLPIVMSDLPLHPVSLNPKCHYLQLADPDFGSPGDIDINFLRGVDLFSMY